MQDGAPDEVKQAAIVLLSYMDDKVRSSGAKLGPNGMSVFINVVRPLLAALAK